MNAWDGGAHQEPEPTQDPLRGVWVNGQPARLLPAERQHGVLVDVLLDKADEPRREW